MAPTYKPVEQHALAADERQASPSSFDDLWRRSSAVLEGVVEKTAPLADPGRPASRVTIRIAEVFKGRGTPRPGSEVLVEMAGAIRDRGAYLESVQDPSAPLLRRNQRPILFLSWSETARAYRLATGTHDSLYLVDGPAIASSGRSALARQLAEQSHGEFAARLRARRDAN
jgi:hypothetical protein